MCLCDYEVHMCVYQYNNWCVKIVEVLKLRLAQRKVSYSRSTNTDNLLAFFYLISSCEYINSHPLFYQNVCVCVCEVWLYCNLQCIIVVAPLLRYGKYCGLLYGGCPGEKPCDELDACCMKHDACIVSKQSMHFPLHCTPHHFVFFQKKFVLVNNCKVTMKW